MTNATLDVLIIGAGVSGVGAACHLRRQCPDKTFAILERRGAIGGTWDLFRYPGIRSDSDMFTFGYSFRPWTEPKVLADGPSIRDYVSETARDYDLHRHIHLGRKVVRADWSSKDGVWTVEVLREAGESGGQTELHRDSRVLRKGPIAAEELEFSNGPDHELGAVTSRRRSVPRAHGASRRTAGSS